MNIRLLLSILFFASLSIASNHATAQCGQAIDLSTWVEEGILANGDWTVGGAGASVTQSINGDPTFYVSPDSFINVIINGRIRVNTTADDDWIGFVFGYQSPDTLDSTYYDFYLFDWKQADQNFSGFFGAEGYSLSRMQGNITNLAQAFAGKQGPFCNLIASDFSTTNGWNDQTNYDFALTYTNTRTVISINGDTIFDIYGCFGPGRFGFYNYSQSDVTYSNFSYRVAASFEVVTPEVCVGDSAFIRALSDSCETNAGVQVNNTIVGWDWDLGDGTTSSDTNVYHVYNAPGTYNVRLVVTDYLGCTDTAYNDIIVNESSVDLGANVSFCADSSVTFDAGTPGSSYIWSTGETTQTIVADTSGSYLVTLTDVNGCESSDTVLVTVFALPTKELPADTSICDGDTLQLDAGNTGSSFVWNTSETTQNIAVTNAGSYRVTITNTNNCENRDTIQLTILSTPIVDLGNDTSICTNDNLILDAQNATGASFLWQDGSINQTFSASVAGQYRVTVTNTNTCPESDTIEITLLALPTVDLGNDSIICTGDSFQLDAQNPTANYLWQDASTAQTLSATAAGSYHVTVTDTNSCSASDTFNLSLYTLPLVDIGVDTSICIGDSISIDPNNSGQTYTWSNGATTESIFIQSAGDFSITVTDANTCENSDTMTLSLYSLPVVNLMADTSICNGDSIALDAQNTGASFAWQNGATTQTINVSQSGDYSVTVTDANTCINTDTFSLSLLALPIVNLGNDSTICPHDTIILNAQNSTASFVWQDASTAQTLNANAAGSYHVTVTDTNTCSASDTFDLSLYTLPLVDLGVDTSICIGDSISIDPNNSGQTYAWSTGDNTEAISINSANDYAVTVTDANACHSSDTMTLLLYSLPVVNLISDTSICSGDSITLDAQNAGSSYVWQNATNAQTLTVSAVGQYAVTVTDVNTCSNSDSMTLSLYSLPVVYIGADTFICNGDTLSLNAQNPTSSFIWQNGATSQTFNATVAGNYSVTVTDTHTCSSSDTMVLGIYALPIVNLGQDTTICDHDTLVLDAQNPTATFVWQNGAHTQTISAFAIGNYRVTVTDTNSCKNIDNINIGIFNLPVVNLGPDTNICDGNNYLLNAQNPGASYVWQNGATAQTFNANSAGIYSVTVTDNNTCSNEDEMELTINQLPVLSISPADTSICLGESVVLQAFGDATIIWLNGVSFFPNGMTSSLSPSVTTTYHIQGTDSIGCTSLFSTNINILALPNIGINLPTDTICKNDTVQGVATGAVNYTWTASSYQLTNNGAANSFFPQQNTSFEVTGTDANGCSNSFDTLIHVNALPQIILTPFGDDLCVGESTFLTASGAENYTWSPSSFITFTTDDTVTITPTDTITYIVTGTDSNQCVNDTSVTINVTPLPVISIAVSDDTVCTGKPSTITAIGAISYLWSPSTNLTGATTNAPTVTPVSTTTYNVTATGLGDCKTYGSQTIQVFDIPNISAGNDTSICKGDTIQLHASGGVTYLWNNADKLNNPNISNPQAYPSAGTFYRVTVTDVHGCDFKDYVFVTVNDKPTAKAGVDKSICPGDTIQIGGAPTGPSGTSFVWSPAGQMISPNVANPFAFADVNTTFKVIVTNQFGCKDSSEMGLFMYDKPTVNLLSAPDFVCKNDSGIVALTPGFANYSFTPTGIAKSVGNGRFEIHTNSSIEISVKATDIAGCWDRITFPFEVKELPKISAGPDKIVCQGDTATIIASGDVVSFFWGNQASLESPNEKITRAYPTTSATYTLSGTDTNGCIGKDDVRVRVHALPVADAGEGLQDCDLGLINLGGDPTGPEFSTYTWWPEENIDNPYVANPSAFIIDSITYYVKVENEFGCVAYDSVTVIPDCYNIYAPNAFTPDGDGINDVFEIKGFRYSNPSIEVYDRWGGILYTSNDFHKGWDGNDAASYPCPVGTYLWRVTFQDNRGRQFREEGRVSLIR